MPVPSAISDLSTTPGLNSPSGSESPASIDDYLRTHAAFIRQVSDASVKTSGDQTIAGVKSFTNNLALTGIAQRITGDFSNATIANRVAFQTSTANSATTVNLLPNGTANISQLSAWNNSDPTNGSTLALSALAAETRVTSGAAGTGAFLPMTFFTNNTERMRIDTTGNVIVTNNTGGLGYGTGAGGTVTQGATSGKATAVTLNRPTGRITMDAAALPASTTVSFVVNNSLYSVNDVVVAVIGGGTSNGTAYQVVASANASGSFVVNVRNISGISLSEALQIQFAIIKGATS